MTGERPNSVHNRINGTEHRQTAIERTSAKDQGRPPIGGWERAGIILGVVGAVVTLPKTAIELYNKLTAGPHIEIDPSKMLDVNWVSDKRLLNIAWDMVIRNSGDADGPVVFEEAQLAIERRDVAKPAKTSKITISEGSTSPPKGAFRIAPSDGKRDIRLTISWQLTDDQWRAFFEEGYRWLTLETTASERDKPIFCFQVTSAIEQTDGRARYGPDPNPGCQQGDSQ